MNPPRNVPSATSNRTASSPTDRKRKHSNRSVAGDDTSSQQHNFQPRPQKRQKSPESFQPSTPSGKRRRHDHIPTPPSRTNLAFSEMYTFNSTRSPAQNSGGVVDLTNGSSPPSPQARRTSMSGRRTGLNPNTGAKKLVVKNLKSNTSWDSKAYLEKIWGQLDEALALMFKDGQDGFSKEDLYRGVENVCRQGGASTLFSRLENRCKSHIERDVREPLLEKAGLDNVTVLKAVLLEWARWTEQMSTIRAIFFFLDRSYLLSSSKPTLDQFIPQLFREVVFSNITLKPKIVDGICDLIMVDRTKPESLDQDLFKRSVDMLHSLSTYSASFEPSLLGRSQHFVAEWSDQMISEKTVPEYVALSDKLIAREMQRCEEFDLDSSTKRELLTLLEDHLIQQKEADLTDYEAVSSLLETNAVADLTKLYALLKRRRLGSNLRPSFDKWVDTTGTSIVFANQADDMVIHLLSLKRRLDYIWQTAFQRDESLGHGLRETFAIFINKTKKGEATHGTDNTKVGEMIAKYVDQLLRGGAKAIPEVFSARRSSSLTASVVPTIAAPEQDNEDDDVDEDAEINIQLDQVLDLFRFVQGKAVFEAFYKKDLARRLLMARSASADAERSMLTRLKTECGSGFTQNLEQMFKDVELAREEMQSYKQRLEERLGFEKGKKVDLSVNILSAAAWPTYPDIPVIIPANIKRAIDDFELHYKSKHTGRKLDWKHALAHCQMKATFGKGSKELVVSSFQAIVMLLFNGLGDGDQLSYSHILSETGLPEAEVKRTLQSLACAKLRPLTKHPRGKEINDTDTFSVNLTFEHPKYRVKINQVQLKETKEENKETHMRVAEDRNFECQAAIVRIMKSRKTISHQELVSEVIKATVSRGVLGMGDIKKNIDRLIEKDYMEREEGNMYSYIA
ncbi:ubiquitin ligase subunit CulD like protein [Zymoseptoria brevis]|uniref:Ubiquitin ligase subunit CulD like protein n=1 Tax=Zymoseptoria brevis TaxID=1047168 RepID=A0A0F4GPW5_9PEZI|nr:ubiquitin ligase subunit CulD like protein [Zymoseptoria brevis]